MLEQIKQEKIYITENHLYQYKVNMIKQEINKYNKIEIPGLKITIKQNDFTEWFIGNLSSQDVDETYKLLQKAKKRSSNIKPILQTIALALMDAARPQNVRKKA